MSARARVLRLRLAASREEDVARGAIVVGDALSIATMPQADAARLYVVRHLDIGSFSRDAAPQTVALQIERRLAGMAGLAVPASDPDAARAPIVWFDDDASAIVALAVRVVAGPPPVEWFWRRIAGGALQQPGRDAVLRACVAAAAALPAAPRATAELVARVEHARPAALFGGLDAAGAARWIAALFAAQPPAAGPVAADAPAMIARLPTLWPALAASWLPRWDDDARAVLLVALALVAAGVAPPSAVRLLARARSLAVGYRAATRTPGAAAAARVDREMMGDVGAPAPRPAVTAAAMAMADVAGDAPVAASEPAITAARAHRSPAPADEPHSTADSGREVAPAGSEAAPAPRAASPAADRPPAATGDARAVAPATDGEPAAAEPAAPRGFTADGATAVGGLLFLLRPLDALDLPGWIDRHGWAAESGFAARLFADLAREHGAAADDPLLLAFDVSPLSRGDRPLVRRAWLRALARWLAAADLTTAQVIRRPAQVAVTTTHIDVAFPLAAASIAIRLAGLDLDPGWVPWLGRVVRFHYLEEVSP